MAEMPAERRPTADPLRTGVRVAPRVISAAIAPDRRRSCNACAVRWKPNPMTAAPAAAIHGLAGVVCQPSCGNRAVTAAPTATIPAAPERMRKYPATRFRRPCPGRGRSMGAIGVLIGACKSVPWRAVRQQRRGAGRTLRGSHRRGVESWPCRARVARAATSQRNVASLRQLQRFVKSSALEAARQ